MQVAFNKEARERFVKFATSPRAIWSSNFRDLNAALTRIATLADAGRITAQIVEDEILRLQGSWSISDENGDNTELYEYFRLTPESIEALYRFDRVQLLDVLEVCRRSRSLAEAGRELFLNSRKNKANYNDADRLRKYLARFDIHWRGRSNSAKALAKVNNEVELDSR